MRRSSRNVAGSLEGEEEGALLDIGGGGRSGSSSRAKALLRACVWCVWLLFCLGFVFTPSTTNRFPDKHDGKLAIGRQGGREARGGGRARARPAISHQPARPGPPLWPGSLSLARARARALPFLARAGRRFPIGAATGQSQRELGPSWAAFKPGLRQRRQQKFSSGSGRSSSSSFSAPTSSAGAWLRREERAFFPPLSHYQHHPPFFFFAFCNTPPPRLDPARLFASPPSLADPAARPLAFASPRAVRGRPREGQAASWGFLFL